MDGKANTGIWQPGRVVAGRYRLDSPVGVGAMGVVWRAADLRLDRTVAVKQVRVPAGSRPEEIPQARQQVFREARIAARLKHPLAVAVYDVTTDDHHQPVLIMEYVPSQSLAGLIEDQGPLPAEQVARIGADTASALTAAHAAGIVHRDVKPANILLPDATDTLDRDAGHPSFDSGVPSHDGSGAFHGTVKITDFGLASIIDDVNVGGSGRVTGTPAFLAPETARGEPHTPASDVFALGATLYTALEGEPPFGSVDDPATQLQRVAYGQARPPRRAGPLTRPLLAMMHEDPTARPTMGQVAQALTAVTYGPDQAFEPDTGLLPAPVARSPRRLRAAVAVFAVLAIGLFGVLVAVLVADDDGAPSAAAPPTSTQSPPSGHSTAPPPAADPAEVQRTVTTYYTLLAEDPGKAWNLLGPGLRDQNREQYEKNWGAAEHLRIRSTPKVSGNTAVVAIEYTAGSGARVRETHQHTVLTQDGNVLINSDDVLSSQVVKDGDKEDPQHEDVGDDVSDHATDDATPAPPPPPGEPYDPPDGANEPEKGGPGQHRPGGPGPGGATNTKPTVDPGKAGSLLLEA